MGKRGSLTTHWSGRSFTIDGKTVLPMKYVRNRFSVSPAGNGTVVTAFIDFQMKFGPVGALMDKLVLRRQFRKVMTHGRGGLNHHVKTGEVVGTKLPKGAVKGTPVA